MESASLSSNYSVTKLRDLIGTMQEKNPWQGPRRKDIVVQENRNKVEVMAEKIRVLEEKHIILVRF